MYSDDSEEIFENSDKDDLSDSASESAVNDDDQEDDDESINSDDNDVSESASAANGDDQEHDEEALKKKSKKKLNLPTLGSSKTDDGQKVLKAGVIYLSTIPPKMNVTRIREYFSQFGDIHRSFIQPEDNKPWQGKRKVKNQTFKEGWIEFRKRKHAKRVAATLNNQPVGGKKSKAYHDFLWNIKYLQGFQWVHLNERLAYERISRQQKLRNEISAAKRESSFFAKNVGLSKTLKKRGLLNKPPPNSIKKDLSPKKDKNIKEASHREMVKKQAGSKASKTPVVHKKKTLGSKQR